MFRKCIPNTINFEKNELNILSLIYQRFMLETCGVGHYKKNRRTLVSVVLHFVNSQIVDFFKIL